MLKDESKKTISNQSAAMELGLIMGIFMIIKFCFYIIGFNHPFLQLVFIVSTLLMPYVAYRLMVLVRNKIYNGILNFSKSFGICFSMHLYASLLVAVAHYVYFHYLDQGKLIANYKEAVDMLAMVNQSVTQDSVTQLKDILDLLGNMSALDITMQLMSNNVLYAIIISLPLALLVKKNTLTNQND